MEEPNTRQRVLLVDDDAALVGLLEKYLGRLGFACDSCKTPEDALALFDANPARYVLVLSDLTFEDSSGEALARRVLERDLRVAVLLISGYPFGVETFAAQYRSRVGYLQKPFLPEMLQDSIEALLAPPGSHRSRTAGA